VTQSVPEVSASQPAFLNLTTNSWRFAYSFDIWTTESEGAVEGVEGWLQPSGLHDDEHHRSGLTLTLMVRRAPSGLTSSTFSPGAIARVASPGTFDRRDA
jgi:hypothetical protein